MHHMCALVCKLERCLKGCSELSSELLNIYLHLNFRANSPKSLNTMFLALYYLGLGINFSPLLRRDCSAHVQYFDKFKTCISIFFKFNSCSLRAEIDRTRKRAILDLCSLLKRLPILSFTLIKRNWKKEVNINANLYEAQVQAMTRLQCFRTKMIG